MAQKLLGTPGKSYQTRGATYNADSNGYISVPAGVTGWDLTDLLNEGCIESPAPPAQFRNLLDGGDFTVNPFQRNVAGLATTNFLTTPLSNTVGYFADRWFGVGASASSSVNMGSVANTTIPGFSTALQFQRTSGNTNTANISFGQVVETADSIRCQGQTVTFSFWAATGSNYSGGPLTVQVISGTGTNQSAANMVAGSWTTQANVVNTTQAINSTMQRYQFTGVVPAACTQLGVLLTYTPTGTAGTNDYIQFMGLQLEIDFQASPFEHRDAQVELEICQRYAWLINEPASGVVVGSGIVSATNTEVFYLATPVQLYKAPTVTTAVGSFKSNSATGGVVAATGLTGNTTHTPNAIGLTSTGTGTAGQGALLQGGGGSGYILASADF
jgi:hypothetical protein